MSDREEMKARLLARRERDGIGALLGLAIDGNESGAEPKAPIVLKSGEPLVYDDAAAKLDELRTCCRELFADPYEATVAMARLIGDLRGHRTWPTTGRIVADEKSEGVGDWEKKP
jgi:hypothetical protein